MTATLKIQTDVPVDATWMPQTEYFEWILRLLSTQLELPLRQMMTDVIGHFPYLSLESLSAEAFMQIVRAAEQIEQQFIETGEATLPIRELLTLLWLDPRCGKLPDGTQGRIILSDTQVWEVPGWVYDLVLLRMEGSAYHFSADLAALLQQARHASQTFDLRPVSTSLVQALRDPVELLYTSYGVRRAVGDSVAFRRFLYPAAKGLYNAYVAAFGEPEIPLDVPDHIDYEG